MAAPRRNDAFFGRRHRRRAARLAFVGLLIVAVNFFVQRNKDRLSKELSALAPGAQTLGNTTAIPKIAFLFLSRGEMPHEQTWKMWFDVAGYLLPRAVMLDACSQGSTAVKDVRAMCQALDYATSGGRDVLAAQMLFSIYIHAPPSFEGYSSDSLWAPYRIFEQIQTRWGDHSLTAATKALLRAAIVNPLNQRFVLVSESDIPLYDPLTFYMQLMSEEKSRVKACSSGQVDMPYRWSDRMKTDHMNATHWRKSSQWFALQRKHAEIVVNDKEVEEKFEKYCNMALDPDLGRIRDCVSDEHYIPVLMAVNELEDEMECRTWGITALDWGNGGSHPKSFEIPQEITPELIYSLRGGEAMAAEAEKAQISAQKQFWPCERVPKTVQKCSLVSEPLEFQAISGGPMLLARKFPAGAAGAVQLLMKQCSSSGLGLLSGRPCSQN
jgi:Core-2/I-Branching enzyme